MRAFFSNQSCLAPVDAGSSAGETTGTANPSIHVATGPDDGNTPQASFTWATKGNSGPKATPHGKASPWGGCRHRRRNDSRANPNCSIASPGHAKGVGNADTGGTDSLAFWVSMINGNTGRCGNVNTASICLDDTIV
jgi:hypothetical protein